MHLLCDCKNPNLVKIRSNLISKICDINIHWLNIDIHCVMKLLLLVNDETVTFYFAIFIEKLFKLVKNSYK